ncbi:MAG: hypothetical protein NTW86_12455, partial [Candidatus Sumerlaeota bacterium]|nr:hypothetical protein [Candidatus Sumerlaeota bacterium]
MALIARLGEPRLVLLGASVMAFGVAMAAWASSRRRLAPCAMGIVGAAAVALSVSGVSIYPPANPFEKALGRKGVLNGELSVNGVTSRYGWEPFLEPAWSAGGSASAWHLVEWTSPPASKPDDPLYR